MEENNSVAGRDRQRQWRKRSEEVVVEESGGCGGGDRRQRRLRSAAKSKNPAMAGRREWQRRGSKEIGGGELVFRRRLRWKIKAAKRLAYGGNSERRSVVAKLETASGDG